MENEKSGCQKSETLQPTVTKFYVGDKSMISTQVPKFKAITAADIFLKASCCKKTSSFLDTMPDSLTNFYTFDSHDRCTPR